MRPVLRQVDPDFWGINRSAQAICSLGANPWECQSWLDSRTDLMPARRGVLNKAIGNSSPATNRAQNVVVLRVTRSVV